MQNNGNYQQESSQMANMNANWKQKIQMHICIIFCKFLCKYIFKIKLLEFVYHNSKVSNMIKISTKENINAYKEST